MSDILHPTRLRWSRLSGGVARKAGVEVRLRLRPPVLRHVEALLEVDYSPGIFDGYLQPDGGARRDLFPCESSELDDYLECIVRAALDAAENNKPPGIPVACVLLGGVPRS